MTKVLLKLGQDIVSEGRTVEGAGAVERRVDDDPVTPVNL
jgi:hypothetical protein